MSGDPRFYQILDKLAELHKRKAEDYGTNIDPFFNIRASRQWGIEPWVAALIRANDKISRLQAFVQKGRLVNESVEDSLLDLASYAIIALILYEEAKDKKDAESNSDPESRSPSNRIRHHGRG
jgi:hypothetical protein